jgi:hypothetical protein
MVEGDKVKTWLSAFRLLQILQGLEPNLPARHEIPDEWNLFNRTYWSVSFFLLEYEVHIHYVVLLQHYNYGTYSENYKIKTHCGKMQNFLL